MRIFVFDHYETKKTKYFLIVSELLHIPSYSSIQLNDSRVMDRVFCEISEYFRCGLKREQACFKLKLLTIEAMSVTGVDDKK